MPRRTTRQASSPTLREQIAAAIVAGEVSIYELAKRTDISTAVLYRFTSGERGISYEALERLVAALGLQLRSTNRRGGGT